MRSILLVLSLSFALAVQAVDFTITEANGTSTERRPSSSSVITDKQINNAHFSRRVVDANNETENLVDREGRHTMIVDSPIRDSDFNFRSVDEHNASDPSVDLKARHTMIIDGEIKDSRFRSRGVNEPSNLETSRDPRDTFIIGGTGSGNRIVELPPRSYNEFIVDGDNVHATHFSSNNGNSVNVMRIGSSFNGPMNIPNGQAAASVQAMPLSSNGGSRFSVSASAPSSGLPGVLQGAVINGATFSRRSVDEVDETTMPMERKSRDTYIDKSQINDGHFSRRTADELDETTMPMERKSRDTWIERSQINNGRFSRRGVNFPRDGVLLA